MYTKRIAIGYAKKVDDAAWQIYNKIAIGVLIALLTVPLMWFMNIMGYQAACLIFYFFALFPGAYVLLQPKMQFYAASVGLGVGTATRADTATSIWKALTTWNGLVVGFVFWYWWLCLLLAFWSFRESPVSFWYLAAALALLSMLTIHMGIDARKRTILVTTLFAFVVIGASLYMSQKSTADKVVDWAQEQVLGSATSATSTDIECPVRTCIFVNSTTWSKKIPIGKGIDFARSNVPGTILEIRVDGNNDKVKEWTNTTNGPRFSYSGSYIQVRLVEGDGAMTYFDSPAKMRAFKRQL